MIERTELDKARGLYSDIHKDVYGFRPRWVADDLWNSVEALDAEIDKLAVELEQVMKEEAEIQSRNVRDFEATVLRTIECGAKDRKTAVRWLMDAEDGVFGGRGYDVGYFEYLWNIPYGYVEKHQ